MSLACSRQNCQALERWTLKLTSLLSSLVLVDRPNNSIRHGVVTEGLGVIHAQGPWSAESGTQNALSSFAHLAESCGGDMLERILWLAIVQGVV